MSEKPTSKFKEQCCGNCKFNFNNHCHRYPPVIWEFERPNAGIQYRQIPTIIEDKYWCGEWKTNE